MKTYVLDACAIMAVLYGEEGAGIVETAFDEAYEGGARIIMHKANLLEVYYDILRKFGRDKSDTIISEIRKRPVEINSEISDEIFIEAGRLKSLYKISFADSFALAQAKICGGALLTCDHHEFDAIEEKEDINFVWIR